MLPAPAYLAWRSTRHHWFRSLLLTACLAIAASLPPAGRVIADRVASSLTERASVAPLVAGAPGSRFDLVIASMYFRPTQIDPVDYAQYDRLLKDPNARPVPVRAAHTARGAPLVATSIEYFQQRGIAPARGRLFAVPGEVVIGAAVARKLGLEPGDTLTTDQRLSYDITQVPAIALRVVGVLAPTRSPDDLAAFIDLETGWIVEGFAHGHDDAQSLTGSALRLGATDEHIALSLAAPTRQTIEPEDLASFHLHGERDGLPLTAILLFPPDARAKAIVSSKIEQSPGLRAIDPVEVAEEVLSFVVRLRVAADVVGGVMLVVTALLTGLVVVLVARLRDAEYRMLADIGASPGTIASWLLWELAILATGAAMLASGLVGVVWLAVGSLLDAVGAGL